MSPKFQQTAEVTGYLTLCARPRSSLMDFFGDGRLIMLYQLYRLLREDRANSHPPTLSPGAGDERRLSANWARKEAVSRER